MAALMPIANDDCPRMPSWFVRAKELISDCCAVGIWIRSVARPVGVYPDEAMATYAKALAAGDPRTRNLYFNVNVTNCVTMKDNQPQEELTLTAKRIRQAGLKRIFFGSDMSTDTNPAPGPWWVAFRRKMPLTDDELKVIATQFRPTCSEEAANVRFDISTRILMNKLNPVSTAALRVLLLALTTIPLASQTADRLSGKNVSIAPANFKGRNAVQVIAAPGAGNGASYAVVKDSVFRDGTIEVDLAGQPSTDAFATARGFIGIAFRIHEDGSYEYIFLRPTNGRAEDQVRRNHSTQYSAHPDFTFSVSRQEAPEKYESYVDLQPGVWTRYKIEVEGRKARLYVNGTEQPCLIVNDLKHEPKEGAVALWVGPGTEGYFSNLKITAR